MIRVGTQVGRCVLSESVAIPMYVPHPHSVALNYVALRTFCNEKGPVYYFSATYIARDMKLCLDTPPVSRDVVRSQETSQ